VIIETRRIILTALKADSTLTAIVPAARIYGDDVPPSPEFPFVRWDAPSTIPFSLSGAAGSSTTSFMLHAFATARLSASKAKLETASDYANRIISAVHGVVHRNRFSDDDGRIFKVTVASRMSMRDGAEADAWHCLLNCVARVLA